MPWSADPPNVNAAWGALIAEELARVGVRHVTLAPGSRSTPLVLGAALHPALDVHVTVDERGAAFLALGIARATAAPVAVVTTSGTAVAHLLPAVIEAALEHVPLILLTADRPPELRDTGANQTIDQVGLFGDHVVWETDLPCPSDRLPASTPLVAIGQAASAARDPGGPVHVNCPFREPLAPIEAPYDRRALLRPDAWETGRAPYWTPPPPRVEPIEDPPAGDGLWARRRRRPSDGGGSAGRARVRARARLALVADIRSGLRLSPVPERVTHVDHLIASGCVPDVDVVVQFGARLVSKRLLAYLERPRAEYRLVDPTRDRLDPTGRVTHRVVATPERWCAHHAGSVPTPPPAWIHRDAEAEAALERAVTDSDALTEPFVARWISRHVRAGDPWVLASSMAVRDAAAFAATDGEAACVFANRGASGIDGTIAFAAGVAIGTGRDTTVSIGDLALLHDLNSLSLVKATPAPVRIVVCNNGGGGIFSFLPIATFESTFSPWFDGRHAWTFEGAARMFDVPYMRVTSRHAFTTAFEEARRSGTSILIEVASEARTNRRVHDELDAAVARALRSGAEPA